MLLEIAQDLQSAQFHLLVSGLIVAVALLLPSQSQSQSQSKSERKQRKQ